MSDSPEARREAAQRQRARKIMTTTTLGLDKRIYGQLLGRALPHVIHTEEECERLTNELMRFDEVTDTSCEERDWLNC
jgi:hypothetical protein